MRYMEIFEEATATDPQTFVERVKTDCKEYLHHNTMRKDLIRGMKQKPKVFLNGSIRERNEKSMWSDYQSAKCIHDLMVKDGFKATRLNGLFCMNNTAHNFNHITHFGSPYVVFPTGNYDLTWFDPDHLNNRGDLGDNGWRKITIGKLIDTKEDAEKYSQLFKDNPTGDDWYTYFRDLPVNMQAELFWKYFGPYFYHGKDVLQATSTGSEIIIAGPSFHAVHYELYQDIKNLIYGDE